MSIRRRAPERGLTLVELIVSIAVIGIGVGGILAVLMTTVRGSSDPLTQKQALAIAESLLDEIELMPFTYCDPDDAQAETAQSAVIGVNGCATQVEAMGPESGEARIPAGGQTHFDNVNDYNGYAMTGIVDITGAVLTGLSGYTASVTVTQQGIPAVISPAVPAIPADEALRITVTVTGPGNSSVQLDGYRTRYAPNLPP